MLGGRFRLPHAATHAIVLPHVLAFNAPAAAGAAARIAASLGARSAVRGLVALDASLDAPTALRDFGMRERDIDGAAAAILPAVPHSNPRPVSETELRAILRDAWAGTMTDPE